MGNFDTATINIFILIFLIIASTVAYLYYIYQQEKKLESREKSMMSDYRKVISSAHQKALSILKKASTQSKDIAKDTQLNNELIEETSNDLMQKIARDSITSLSTVSKEFVTEYKEALLQAKTQYNQQVAQTLLDMTKTTELELTSYRDGITSKAIAQEKELTQLVQAEFLKAKESIESYKKTRIDEIDSSVQEMLVKISEKVFGQTIPMAQHQKLIQKALEQAKQEGMFNQNV